MQFCNLIRRIDFWVSDPGPISKYIDLLRILILIAAENHRKLAGLRIAHAVSEIMEGR